MNGGLQFRFRRLLPAIAVVLLLGGCALRIIPRADVSEPAVTADGVVVFGRINYVIDGRMPLPYGAFRPDVPAPHIDAVSLDTGTPYQSHAVAKSDGAFVWRLPPGHYVITGIGQGTFTDPYRIAWPRVAFRVPAAGTSVYLGDLRLVGTSYTETFTYSTGKVSTVSGIRYDFAVTDEITGDSVPRPGPAAAPVKSLMFVKRDMPIGEGLVRAWQASREATIESIFGGASQ